MWFERMTLEVWFDAYQYDVEYDVGESAVKFLSVEDLDIDLAKVALRYGHHTGDPRLRECLATQYPGLSSDQIVVTSGASEAIFALNSSLVKPGDHVIVEHPNYPSLYDIPRSLGCQVSLFSLEYDREFKPDLSKLEDLITPKTKMISLTHPNNPTGSMISEDGLLRVIALAEKHDIYLMFDETYRELDCNTPLPQAATLSPKVISVSTMSKCYGLPGIRIGWLATQDRFILDSILTVREQITITNNTVGEAIALHILEKRDGYLKRSRAYVEKNLAAVSRWMDGQTDVEWIRPAAGVVGLPRLKENVKIDPERLYRTLAEKYKTFVIPGRCFELDNRYFRLGYGAKTEEIEQGLQNINTAINELRE